MKNNKRKVWKTGVIAGMLISKSILILVRFRKIQKSTAQPLQ